MVFTQILDNSENYMNDDEEFQYWKKLKKENNKVYNKFMSDTFKLMLESCFVFYRYYRKNNRSVRGYNLVKDLLKYQVSEKKHSFIILKPPHKGRFKYPHITFRVDNPPSYHLTMKIDFKSGKPEKIHLIDVSLDDQNKATFL